jgi:hypothetical protein
MARPTFSSLDWQVSVLFYLADIGIDGNRISMVQAGKEILFCLFSYRLVSTTLFLQKQPSMRVVIPFARSHQLMCARRRPNVKTIFSNS